MRLRLMLLIALVALTLAAGGCSLVAPRPPIELESWSARGPMAATVAQTGLGKSDGEWQKSVVIVAGRSPDDSTLGQATVYYDDAALSAAPDILRDFANDKGELPWGPLLMGARVRLDLEKRGDRWWASSLYLERVKGD